MSLVDYLAFELTFVNNFHVGPLKTTVVRVDDSHFRGSSHRACENGSKAPDHEQKKQALLHDKADDEIWKINY